MIPSTKIRPIYNQIVVLRDEAPVKIGLIIVPGQVRDRLQKESTSGIVLAVGPGRYRRVRAPHRLPVRTIGEDTIIGVLGICLRCGQFGGLDQSCPRLVDTNERVPLDVRVGDRVWFHHLAGTSDMDRMVDVEENGRRLTVMWDDEVMAFDGDVRGELELAEMLEQPGTAEAMFAAMGN